MFQLEVIHLFSHLVLFLSEEANVCQALAGDIWTSYWVFSRVAVDCPTHTGRTRDVLTKFNTNTHCDDWHNVPYNWHLRPMIRFFCKSEMCSCALESRILKLLKINPSKSKFYIRNCLYTGTGDDRSEWCQTSNSWRSQNFVELGKSETIVPYLWSLTNNYSLYFHSVN